MSKKDTNTIRQAAIRMIMMPRDTNAYGSIFGGYILSLIDQAAGQHARTIATRKFVTKVMREVEFIAPVYVGDVVSLYCNTLKLGNTSVSIRVEVEATRDYDGDTCRVTTAEVIMVAVNDNGVPTPIHPEKP